MQSEPKKSSIGFFVSFLLLLGALALFGVRMLKTEGGRQQLAEWTGSTSSAEKSEQEKQRQIAIAAMREADQISKLEDDCDVAPEPKLENKDAFLARSEAITDGTWPRYTSEQVACLKSKGVYRTVGYPVRDMTFGMQAPDAAVTPPVSPALPVKPPVNP
jgi:hypothetical protein